MPKPSPLPSLAKRKSFRQFLDTDLGIFVSKMAFLLTTLCAMYAVFLALSLPLSTEKLQAMDMSPCVRQHAIEHVAGQRAIRQLDIFRIKSLCKRETAPEGPWREQLEILRKAP